MLQVLLLGPVEARGNDGGLRLSGRMQRTLLARLAIAAGHPVSSDALVEDLWGDSPPADPGHALQAHVSRLRTELPVEIELVAGGYRIVPEDVEVDTARFTQLCEEGHNALSTQDSRLARSKLRAALSLWRGPVFADLAGATGLRLHAIRLEEVRRDAVADRIDADLSCGDRGALVPELRALLAEHPLHERHWGQLMITLHREGRESEALDTYRQARELFADQLGTEPGEQLQQLHQEFLASIVPDDAAGADSASGAPRSDHTFLAAGVQPPSLPRDIVRRVSSSFTGRDREFETLAKEWSRSGDDLRMVTITGEPGIGKTRLAAEFGAALGDQGTQVLFGRCDTSLTVPYQPFTEMMRSDLHALTGDRLMQRLGPHPAELTRLLPELATRLPDDVQPLRSDAATEQYRTFDAVAGWFAEMSKTEPLVIVIDDLQWAEQQTVLLLRHLVRSPRAIRGLVIATYRDRELAGAEARSDLVTGFTRQSETLVHLPLTGLDEHEATALFTAELGAAGAPHTSDDLPAWVASSSGGNPLFVVELARQFAGADEAPAASGRPASEATIELPAGLREVVESRLDRLPAQLRELLSHAAIIGREFDPLVLRATSDIDEIEIDDLIRSAAHAQLIEPVTGPRLRYAFCHDVVRAALYDMTPPLHRAAAHRRVAEAIELIHAGDPHPHHHDLGHHYSAAAVVGSTEEAVHYLRLAGDADVERRAPAVAIGHYRRALELMPVAGGYAPRCDLLTSLGIAELHAGDPGYRETLLTSARLAREAGDPARLTAAAVANNRGWWSSTAGIDLERVAILEEALATCDEADHETLVKLLASWSVETVRDPVLRTLSIERSATSLALAEQLGDEELLTFALSHRYAVVYAAFSDPKACVDLSERLEAIAHRRADPGLRLSAATGLAQSTMIFGEYAISDRALARAAQLGEVLDQPARLWMTRCWQAMRTATRGHLEEAEALAGAAYELGSRTEQPDALTWYAGQLFTFRLMAERLPEMIDVIEEQVANEADGIPTWRAAYALTLAKSGRAAEAALILDEFTSPGSVDLPVDMLWLQGIAYLCDTCVALNRPDAAHALYDALLPYTGLIAHNGTLDAGPVDLHLGAMAQVSGDHEAAAQHLAAAEILCRRINAPLWLSRVRTMQAHPETKPAGPQLRAV